MNNNNLAFTIIKNPLLPVDKKIELIRAIKHYPAPLLEELEKTLLESEKEFFEKIKMDKSQTEKFNKNLKSIFKNKLREMAFSSKQKRTKKLQTKINL